MNGKGSLLQVFYLNASDLTNSIDVKTYRGVDFSFNRIPEDASVVVNIIGDAPVEFNTGWRFWWNGEEISRGYEEGDTPEAKRLRALYSTVAQSILWNFTTAKQVTIRGGMALESNKDLGGTDDKWTDDDPAAAMLGSIIVPNGSFEDHVTTNGRVYVGGDFEMYNPTVAWDFTNLEGNRLPSSIWIKSVTISRGPGRIHRTALPLRGARSTLRTARRRFLVPRGLSMVLSRMLSWAKMLL